MDLRLQEWTEKSLMGVALLLPTFLPSWKWSILALFNNTYRAKAKNTADLDSRYENLVLSTKQKQYMQVGSKLYYSETS